MEAHNVWSSSEAAALSPSLNRATIDQINPAYHEDGGDPYVVTGILGSSPCSRRCGPHHHQISRCIVDLVEGATRQSGTEVRSAMWASGVSGLVRPDERTPHYYSILIGG
jgi:hypothetical protein